MGEPIVFLEGKCGSGAGTAAVFPPELRFQISPLCLLKSSTVSGGEYVPSSESAIEYLLLIIPLVGGLSSLLLGQIRPYLIPATRSFVEEWQTSPPCVPLSTRTKRVSFFFLS